MLHHTATSLSGCMSRMKPISNCSNVMLMYGPITSKTALICSSISGGNDRWRIGPGRSCFGSMYSGSLIGCSLVLNAFLLVQPLFRSRLSNEYFIWMRRKDRRTGTWFVYVLRCADGTLYTGIAKDVNRRRDQHNAGTASRYTRSRLPVELVYQEAHASRG